MTDTIRNPLRCRRNVIFVALLAISCGDRGPQSVASTQRLVDLFNHESTEVADSPQIQSEPRAAWRFDTPSPADSPFNGWTSEMGVDGLQVVEGRLSGDVTDDVPILHVEWVDGGGLDDRLRSVEVDLLRPRAAIWRSNSETKTMGSTTSRARTGPSRRRFCRVTSRAPIASQVMATSTPQTFAMFSSARPTRPEPDSRSPRYACCLTGSTWRRHPQALVGRV